MRVWLMLLILAACAPVQYETKAVVPLDEIVPGGPPRDGIPAIDRPNFVSVEEAQAFVHDNTLGIFVEVNNDRRFYPFNILTWHEIVNDVVGGKPLAVTFCPLCASALVFEREVNGKILDFGTSGMLYQSNLVMYDRQTESLWSQILGKSIVGKLSGTELLPYPSNTLLFSTVKEKVPNAKVLSVDTGYERDYQHNPYYDYEASDEIIFPIKNKDARLPAKTYVWTISIDGKMKSYVYDELIKKKRLQDTLNGHELEITVDEMQQIRIIDKTTNKPIIGFRAFWFSVAAHNPDIEVWIG